MERKEELKNLVKDVGLRKSNNIYIKDMDEKLKMIEENFGELEGCLEDPEVFERKLGIPISETE